MPDPTIEIRFEDTRIACHQGDSIAAALTAAGHYVLSDAPGTERRGVYCGMGVCQACVVTIEGRGVRRACMEPVVNGMRVSRYTGVGRIEGLRTQAPDEQTAELNLEPELLVVGGGPAGLAAASTAAELGVSVVLLDERTQPGGQYYKQSGSARPTPAALAGDRQFTDGRALIDRAIAAGVRIVSGATVWGAFPGPELAVALGEQSCIFRPRRLLVATGAYESGTPVPGWTSPRVMTIGAGQTLLRSYGVKVGDTLLVAGNGPLNFQVALELHRAGAEIALLTELAPMLNAAAPLHFLRMLIASPTLALQGAALMVRLRAARIPIRRGWGVGDIRERENGLEVDVGVATPGGIEQQETLSVDAVCLGYGFFPNNELLRMLGCRHQYDNERHYLTTLRNEHCETSVAGIFAVGDCCGLGGAPAAMEEGTLAANAIAKSLDLPIGAALNAERRRAASRLKRHRQFQRALWRLFGASPPGLDWATADTAVCRCENVTLEALDASIAAGCTSLAELKQRSRIGMGACQGRYCTSLALAALAKAGQPAPGEYSMFAPQAPLKPLSIEQICAGGD